MGAKRIGQQAIKVLPELQTGGAPVKNVLVRTDVGCSDSQLHDKYTNWNPNKKTFFLNEIEPSSTTYFVRWLQHDCMPVYAKLYATKAREIFKQMQKGKTGKILLKKPAGGVKRKAASPMKVIKRLKK